MWPLSLQELLGILQARQCIGSLSQDHRFDSISTDSRNLKPGQLFVALKGDKFDGHDFALTAARVSGVAALVSQAWFASLEIDLSVNVPRLVVVQDVLESFRLLAAHFRKKFLELGPDRCLVAVGGSNGKTTTKEMLVCMLGGRNSFLLATEKSENGFVGIPKSLCQESATEKLESIILEVGIDETDSMTKHVDLVKPDIAALTSLSHEHLEGFGTLEKVVEEELILMDGPWVRVWQCEDPIISQKAQAMKRAGDWFVHSHSEEVTDSADARSLSQQVGREQGLVLFCSGGADPLAPEVSFSVRFPGSAETNAVGKVQLPMPGSHHAANFALALAMACERGRKARCTFANKEQSSLASEMRAICNGAVQNFRQFVPPDMRSNIVRFKNNSVILIDCYNSNPASLRASLELVKHPYFVSFHKFLFLGDMLDLGSSSESLHQDIISELESMPECQLYLFGEAMYSVYVQLMKSRGSMLLKHLPRRANPQEWLNELQFANAPNLVLVKGSRGMAMERLIPGLKEKLSGFG